MSLRRFGVAIAATLELVFAATPGAWAVVGGSDAGPGDAPYVVSVRSTGLLGVSHICGGFLLSANKVVTAAHCVDGQNASSLSVTWGGTGRASLPRSSSVSKIGLCACFNAETLQGDIAVLTLSTAASETSGVRFADLATADPATGTTATLSGWGSTDGSRTLPTALQSVQLPVMDKTGCANAYAELNIEIGGDGDPLDGLLPAFDTTTEGCIGKDADNSGACYGDSGSPIVVNGAVVGIVSWRNTDCTATSSPTVYTSTAYYRSWIISQ